MSSASSTSRLEIVLGCRESGLELLKRIDENTLASIKSDIGRLCQQQACVSGDGDGEGEGGSTLSFLSTVVSLYQRILVPGCRILQGRGLLHTETVVRVGSCLQGSNSKTFKQLVASWALCLPADELRADIELHVVSMVQEAESMLGKLLVTCSEDPGRPDVSGLACLCDRVHTMTVLLASLEPALQRGSVFNWVDFIGHQQAVLFDVVFVIYNEVLPKLIHSIATRGSNRHSTGPAPDVWLLVHSTCRKCVKAVWQVLQTQAFQSGGGVSRKDETGGVSVSRFVDRLLLVDDTPLTLTLRSGSGSNKDAMSSIESLIKAVSSSSGWAMLPAAPTDVCNGGLLASDIKIVHRDALRDLLARTIYATDDSSQGNEMQCDYLMSCFGAGGSGSGGGNGSESLQTLVSSSLLLLTLRWQLGLSEHVDSLSPAQQQQQSTAASSASSVQRAEGPDDVAALASLFPDYGHVFLRACLNAFDNSLERAVDALVTENLPPSLAGMDRSVKALWVGKGATDRQLHVPTSQPKLDSGFGQRKTGLNSAATSFVPALTEKEKQALKLRNRAYDADNEANLRVLNAEYGDDYDDQFDEPSPAAMSAGGGADFSTPGSTNANANAKSTAGEAASAGAATAGAAKRGSTKTATMTLRKEKKAAAKSSTSGGGSSNIYSSTAGTKGSLGGSYRGAGTSAGSGIDDIKRYNSLLRSEEVEQAYWEGMKNTNVPKARRRFDEEQEPEDGEGQGGGHKEHQQLQGQGQGGALAKAKATGSAGGKEASTPIGGRNSIRQTDTKRHTHGAAGNINKNNSNTSDKGVGGNRNKTTEGSDAMSEEVKKKKFNDRKFDKHHQKDRSTRKFGV